MVCEGDPRIHESCELNGRQSSWDALTTRMVVGAFDPTDDHNLQQSRAWWTGQAV